MKPSTTVPHHRSGKPARWRWVAALGVAAALVAAACGGDNKSSSPTTAGGTGTTAAGGSATTAAGGATTAASASGKERTLVVARNMDVNSLDPQRAYCDTCQIFLSATYETLIGLDTKDNKTFVPRLATEWLGNEDQTVFTFKLDPKAVFSDGSPVEAKDVKWSWERLQNIKGSASYLMTGIKSIDTPDAHTVVATFNAPNSAFLAIVNATYMGIVNSDIATAQGAQSGPGADTGDKAEQWFLSNSAGSGPFTLKDYQEGSELRLARNDKYWGTKPPFPEVILKETKDAVTQRQLLESGEADIAMQISNDVAKDMKTGGDVTVEKAPSFNFVYIALSPGAKGNTTPLTPEVREAIKDALDYEGILDVTVGGSGKKQASPIPNGFLGSDGLTLPTRDLTKAKDLMAKAGLAGGFDIEATYPQLNVYGVDFTTMMQKVQTDLKEININVKLTPVEFTVWIDKIQGDGIPLTAVYFAPDHTDTSQYVQYFGMIPDSPWGGRAGPQGQPVVVPAEVDGLTKALAEKDVTKRAADYNQTGAAMQQDLIILPLVNPDLFLAYRSDVTNMHYSACCNLELGKLGLSG
jgi:peptide/nickel transport system substrate-binding protein